MIPLEASLRCSSKNRLMLACIKLGTGLPIPLKASIQVALILTEVSCDSLDGITPDVALIPVEASLRCLTKNRLMLPCIKLGTGLPIPLKASTQVALILREVSCDPFNWITSDSALIPLFASFKYQLILE